ncbi:MAG TPA: AbrB/MazE/SpoVT family DNA-binding domain-containing protein [Solirubrobacterales bacterium]|jgi:AbrB family looped-hinge helix DNA binding protein|nr:AbrB/MazE/SpoVT family DNA-binding domain-containing protein [Solirubrobacterales bacterium]
MRITSKGQVTIPKEIRDNLGFLPGTEVEFFVENGVARVRKAQGGQTRGRETVEHLREAGRRADFTMTTEEIMRLTRGEDWGTGRLEEGDGDPA